MLIWFWYGIGVVWVVFRYGSGVALVWLWCCFGKVLVRYGVGMVLVMCYGVGMVWVWF